MSLLKSYFKDKNGWWGNQSKYCTYQETYMHTYYWKRMKKLKLQCSYCPNEYQGCITFYLLICWFPFLFFRVFIYLLLWHWHAGWLWSWKIYSSNMKRELGCVNNPCTALVYDHSFWIYWHVRAVTSFNSLSFVKVVIHCSTSFLQCISLCNT